MARQQRAQRPDRKPASLTTADIQDALPKLRRRLAEVEGFDVTTVVRVPDQRIDILANKMDATLVDVFGAESLEYQRYRVETFYQRQFFVPLNRGPTIDEVRQRCLWGIDQARAKLQSAIETLQERLEESGGTGAGRALRAIDGLDLHPEIDRAAGQLYRNGHYANAVEDACKALNTLVKLRSGRDDLDGMALMQEIFSERKPILRFNDLSDESERNEQRGMMYLFAGAITGLRNPRAHKIIKDDPERALEFIGLVSLLAKLLDESRK